MASLAVYRLPMVIDHAGPTPPYRQVADILAAQIRTGALPPDRPVPSEKALMQTYGIARSTARKVIRYLREQGLVYTVPGRGSYVADTHRCLHHPDGPDR